MSGDIDNNDINTDGNFIAETITDIQGENAYHVVFGSGTDISTIFDGFIITAGQANGKSDYSLSSGGGMYNRNSSPTLTNVIFSANSADNNGGGMYNSYNNPTLASVTFSANSADSNGGGMHNNNSNLMLTDITFSNNFSKGSGGGMHNGISNLTLTNVIFSTNSADHTGGGMYHDEGQLSMTNVIFSLYSKDMWRFGAPPGTPSELFRKHVWVSPFFEDDVPALTRRISAEHVLAGSDYPHPEGLASPREFEEELGDLSAGERQLIMRENFEQLIA